MFFLPHTEAVFFVDDDQPQLLELDVALQQLVRADDDIDLAFAEPGEGFIDLLLRTEARQLADFDWPVGETVGEGIEVLFSEQRGRHQHRDLLAFVDRDKGGAQGHLGFAEADVAADEAIHRLALLQIGQRGVDGGPLVGRFLEGKSLAKRVVIMLDQTEGMAFTRRALRIEIEQFGGGVAHALGSSLLRLFPLAAAEIVQWRGLRRAAAVAADQMQLRHRHIEFVAARVFKGEEFGGAVAEIEILQTQIAADAVTFVNDRIADLDFGQIAQHAFAGGLARFTLTFRAHLCRVEFVFSDDDKAARVDKARVARSDAQHQGSAGNFEFIEGGAGDRFQPIAGKVFEHGFAAAGGFGQQQRTTAVAGQKRLERDQRIFCAAIDHNVRQCAGAFISRSRGVCHHRRGPIFSRLVARRLPGRGGYLQRGNFHPRKRLDCAKEGIGGEE